MINAAIRDGQENELKAALQALILAFHAEVQAGQDPDLEVIEATIKQLRAVRAEPRIFECFLCRQEFNAETVEHCLILVQSILDITGQVMPQYPPNSYKMAACGTCWNKHEIDDYLTKR